MAGSQVAAQGELYARIRQRTGRHDPGDHADGGVRALDGPAAVLFQDADILLRGEDEVGAHNGPIVQKTRAFIDLRVAGAVREQAFRFRGLPAGLHQVGLQPDAVFRAEPAEAEKQLAAAGGGKARRQDRSGMAIGAVLFQKTRRLPQASLRGLPQLVGAGGIHVDLAHVSVQPQALQAGEQIAGGCGVDRAEDDGVKRAVGDQIVSKGVVDRTGKVQIGKASLQREGVVRQPVGQQLVHGEAALGILRCVDMEIRKGRDQHVLPQFRDRRAAQRLRHGGIDALYDTALHREIAVGVLRQLFRAWGVDDAAVIQFHSKSPFSFSPGLPCPARDCYIISDRPRENKDTTKKADRKRQTLPVRFL